MALVVSGPAGVGERVGHDPHPQPLGPVHPEVAAQDGARVVGRADRAGARGVVAPGLIPDEGPQGMASNNLTPVHSGGSDANRPRQATSSEQTGAVPPSTAAAGDQLGVSGQDSQALIADRDSDGAVPGHCGDRDGTAGG